MTAVSEVSTVLDRMLAAGVSEERARAHLDAGRVRVDGDTVRDPQAPAAGSRIVVAGQ